MITPKDLALGVSITHALLVQELETLIDVKLREMHLRGSQLVTLPAKFRPVLSLVLNKYREYWRVDEEFTAQMERQWIIRSL